MAKRHVNLISAVESTVGLSKKNKPFRIVAIGDTSGQLSLSMVKAAKRLGKTNIEYFAFDTYNPSIEGAAAATINKDKIRSILGLEGVKKIRIVGGDSSDNINKVANDIVIADIVFISGDFGVEKVAVNLQDALTFCNENSVILLDSLFPSDYSRGCAFVLKSFGYLKKKGITVDEVGPADDIYPDGGYAGDTCPVVKMLKVTCKSQATPAYLVGLATTLLVEASLLEDPANVEIVEFIPERSFLEDAVDTKEEPKEVIAVIPESPSPTVERVDTHEGSASFVHVESVPVPAPAVDSIGSLPKGDGADDSVGSTFPVTSGGCDSNVQPIRVCENSCGKLSEEHCELPSDHCGRREPSVGCGRVVEVPVEPACDAPVHEERQESDAVVEQGCGDSVGEQVPSDSGSKLRSEVSPELGSGNTGGSRRRRRRGGSDDKRPGAPS